MTLHHGDCLDVMAAMEPESVDAIVTDPPYGLEFMGKEWDRLGGGAKKQSKPGIGDRSTGWVSNVGWNGVRCRNCGHLPHGGSPCSCESPDWRQDDRARLMQEWHVRWAEAAYRVAKPSAYLLAFGGTRTVHRMTVALEDAGWIIRDMLVWGYASGFPKSKASLKPAWEPIVMARKPGPLRMLNIDECRIPMSQADADNIDSKHAGMDVDGYERPVGTSLHLSAEPMPLQAAKAHESGRWPANIVLTDPIFDGGWDGVVGGGETGPAGVAVRRNVGHSPGRFGFASGAADADMRDDVTYSDSGTYSRFFIIPKADRADREPVLGGMPRPVDARMGLTHGGPGEPGKGTKEGYEYHPKARANVHPTVKPTDLMRHLVRLVTPTGGVVLDPFLGSGTTALAAELEGFDWIGIEREAEYVAIAEARLNGTQRGLGLGA